MGWFGPGVIARSVSDVAIWCVVGCFFIQDGLELPAVEGQTPSSFVLSDQRWLPPG